MKNKDTKSTSTNSLENEVKEEFRFSFDEIWHKALEDVENRKIEEPEKFMKEFKEDELIEEEYKKKYGKEPEMRTPDGKVNEKYIEYVLRRDYEIEPDRNDQNTNETFSWGGLTGEKAYIAYWNCD